MRRLFLFIAAIPIAASLAACGSVEDGSVENNPDAGESDGQAAQDADATITPNLVFATRGTYNGQLGGLVGADTICTLAAEAAGHPGRYVAWMSDETADARDRLGVATGWVRADGQPVAATVDDLLSGALLYTPHLDAQGAPVFSSRAWTGTNTEGRYDATGFACRGWASSQASVSSIAGNPRGHRDRFTSAATVACQTTLPLLCFGIDRRAEIETPNRSGQLVYVTAGSVTGDVGIEAFDQMCSDEADLAGLSGEFLAGVADSTSGITRFDLLGTDWVRPDGVAVHDAGGEVGDGFAEPIALRANGSPSAGEVWTGIQEDFGLSDDCASFTDRNGDGGFGDSALGGGRSVFLGEGLCSVPRSVYCFEQ